MFFLTSSSGVVFLPVSIPKAESMLLLSAESLIKSFLFRSKRSIAALEIASPFSFREAFFLGSVITLSFGSAPGAEFGSIGSTI